MPSSRAWSRELDVGRPTLLNALKILEHEGLLKTTPRGTEIVTGRSKRRSASGGTSRTAANKKPLTQRPLVARFLYYGRSYQELQQGSKWFLALSWVLQSHGIRLALERCNSVRLRSIAEQPPNPNELCFLYSLPVPYQRLFVRRGRQAIVVGYAGEGVNLPFVSPDLTSSARHAALRLLRQKFKHLILINLATREEGVARSIEGFQSACDDWPHQPVHAEVVRVWNDLESQRSTMARLARRIKDPCGFLVFTPIPVGLVATALLQRGISIPDQAAIVAIEHAVDDVSLSVPITLYPFPSHRFAKVILSTCLRYFETGAVPTAGRILELDAPKEV